MTKKEKVIQKIILIHTNKVVEIIPRPILEFYEEIEYNVLIRPLVLKDLKDKIDISKLTVKYGVSYSTINHINNKYYAKRNND